MALLVRIKRKLNEEPLESVVLGRQSNPKRANVDDLRHALKDTSLSGPQVFRLLSSSSPNESGGGTLLPSNLLDTIAKRKKEWGTKTRRLSPRKSVKSTFERAQSSSAASVNARIEGQLQQSKSQRQARVWNCRRVKVQGFSVLEFSDDDKGKEVLSAKPVEPWVKRQPLRKDIVTSGRLRELEQEAKARTLGDTKTLKRAKGWRQWQDQHRPELPPAQNYPQGEQHHPLSAPEALVPQQYADLLKEYFGEEDESEQAINFCISSSHISSSSFPASSSSSSSSFNTELPDTSTSSSALPRMEMSSHIETSSSMSGRDYVWDLYYCCGSEQDTDPNAVALIYESEESSDAESEDSDAKEHDYSDEESLADEGEESSEEETDDSEGIMNKRMTRWKDNDDDNDEAEERDGDD